jgi:hypothetical protein
MEYSLPKQEYSSWLTVFMNNPGNNKFIYFIICFASVFHGVAVAVIILTLEKILIRQEIISDYLIDNIHEKKIKKFESIHLFKN